MISKTRKSRDIENEELQRSKLAEKLSKKLGPYTTIPEISECWFLFHETPVVKVLAKYSSNYNNSSKWFWGITERDWELWKTDDLIALIYQNDIGGNSYILLKQPELKRILSNTKPSKDGSRKINMRKSSDTDKLYFQEMNTFDIAKRSCILK